MSFRRETSFHFHHISCLPSLDGIIISIFIVLHMDSKTHIWMSPPTMAAVCAYNGDITAVAHRCDVKSATPYESSSTMWRTCLYPLLTSIYIRKLVTLLGPTPRSKWNAMVASGATAFPATGAGWALAKQTFLEVFTEDPDARETLLATFYDNSTFTKLSVLQQYVGSIRYEVFYGEYKPYRTYRWWFVQYIIEVINTST